MCRVGGEFALQDDATLELDVSPKPESCAAARRQVAAFLAARGVSSVVVDDIELVTSELVTNAMLHGRPGPIEVLVAAGQDVVLHVTNTGRTDGIPPVTRWQPTTPFALSGRGLGIVRRLCDEVAVSGHDGRATVSCRRRLCDEVAVSGHDGRATVSCRRGRPDGGAR